MTTRRADSLAIAVLVAVGIGLPVVIGAISGSLLIPHNDDFGYRRVASEFLASGRIELTGWTVMSLVGQLALVLPILALSGGASWAFAATTAIVAGVGIAAGYLLARRLLGPARSFLAAFLVVVFPGFILNTTSFMTDTPSFAGQMVCLLLGAIAIERDGPTRWRWAVAAVAVGWLAFAVREFSIAAPVAVLIALAAARAEDRRRVIVTAVVLIVACVLTYLVTSRLPGQGTPYVQTPNEYTVHRTIQGLTTLTFGLFPAIVVGVSWWWRRVLIPETVIGGLLGAILVGAASAWDVDAALRNQFVGNLFVQEGAPGSGVLAGARPLLFEPIVWTALNVISIIATVAGAALLGGIVGLEIRRSRGGPSRSLGRSIGSVAGVLVVFVVLVMAGMTVYGLIVTMFDRYLWTLVIPISVLLMMEPRWAADAPLARRGIPRPAWIAAAGSGATLITLVSLALLLNTSAFDVARWRMGEAAVAAGYAPETVDAGMEWVGFHVSGTAEPRAPAKPLQTWYSSIWRSFHECGLVSNTLLDINGLRLLHADIAAYRLLLVGGPEQPLYLYAVDRAGCPSPT